MGKPGLRGISYLYWNKRCFFWWHKLHCLIGSIFWLGCSVSTSCNSGWCWPTDHEKSRCCGWKVNILWNPKDYMYIYPAHIHPLLVACCMLQVVRNKIVVWVWEDRTVWQECRMGTWYTSILVMAVTGTGTGTGTKLGPGLRTLPSRVPYPSYSVPYAFTVICDTNTI